MEATKRAGSNFDDTKKVGIGEFEVAEFNKPEDSDGKEIVYTGESKEGNKTFRLAITLKEVKTGKYFPLSFFLEDRERTNKNGDKTQYINQLGRTSWADKVENLHEKFTASPYHAARIGEEEVTNFLMSWLNIDRKAPYDMSIDWKALMKGNVKEFTDLMKSDLASDDKGNPRTIVGMAIVRVAEKDGEVKEYQGIYNRKLLPGYTMKFFRTTKFTPELIQDLREKKERYAEAKSGYLKNYEEFILDISSSEYGIKSDTAYFLGEMKEYDPTENMVAGDKVLDETSSDY